MTPPGGRLEGLPQHAWIRLVTERTLNGSVRCIRNKKEPPAWPVRVLEKMLINFMNLLEVLKIGRPFGSGLSLGRDDFEKLSYVFFSCTAKEIRWKIVATS